MLAVPVAPVAPHLLPSGRPRSPASVSHTASGSAPAAKRVLTSGQHDADPALLQPYANFPKEITGGTVWTKEQYEGEWKRTWPEELVGDLERAYEAFERTGLPLTAINRVSARRVQRPRR
jgi:hypothetical protein